MSLLRAISSTNFIHLKMVQFYSSLLNVKLNNSDQLRRKRNLILLQETIACNEDKGFAINPWTKVRFENSNIILEKIVPLRWAITILNLNGDEAKVEYTFGYKLAGGQLKIDLHHSSFPYSS